MVMIWLTSVVRLVDFLPKMLEICSASVPRSGMRDRTAATCLGSSFGHLSLAAFALTFESAISLAMSAAGSASS